MRRAVEQPARLCHRAHVRRQPRLRRAAGISIPRNTGVTLVWITDSYKPFKDGAGGWLIRLFRPVECLWFAEGRPATRAEVLASIDSGMPLLADMAAQQGPDAEMELRRCYRSALEVIPA